MKCPVCRDVKLVMSERQGVEIDYCPSCRGVWLDRGELDKIIDKNSTASSTSSQNLYSEQRHSKENYKSSDHKSDNYNNQGHHKKKKEGFLSELFDFDF